MSGAAKASEELRAAAMQHYAALRDRVGHMAAAVAEVRKQTDIVLLLTAIDDYSMAAKDLAEAAKVLHESADEAMVATMTDTGCTAFATAYHTTSLREGVPSVDITDRAAVPAAFLTKSVPIPDKRLIAQVLKTNGATNWARLIPGKPGLMRRSKA